MEPRPRSLSLPALCNSLVKGLRSLAGRRFVWVIVAMLLLCLVVRSLPYLAPVRSADMVQHSGAVEFRDRHNLLLGTLLSRDQDHTSAVPMTQVSPWFVQAILAAEDGRFYRHGVLEGRAIVRSVLEAIRTRGFRSGASTITMQLARMVQPVPSNFWGKVQEVWLAWRIAAGTSKDEILTAYINRVPMGGNIYGVEAAARSYFGVAARDLTLAQASLLAALPNDPVYLDPYRDRGALRERQAYVLNRMVADGYVDRAQASAAYAETLTFQAPHQGILAAPHYLFWLAAQLPENHPPQVRTSLDRSLQQFTEAQVTQVLADLKTQNVNHAAVLVLDNGTGDVLAYVGSPNYTADAEQGKNDGVQALRQPGSSLKPFVYELALELGVIRPNTILADVPTHYAIPGAKLYSPTDYSETFQGPVRVRVALANSLNIPAVRVLEKVGVQRFLDRLHQLGFSHLTQTADHYGLGLTLGSGEVSLWELAHAYRSMALFAIRPSSLVLRHSADDDSQPTTKDNGQRTKNKGQRTKNKGQLSTLDSSPSTLHPSPSTPSHAWSLVTDILSDRHARAQAFGVDSVLDLPFAAAVKTGTSSDYRDTWTVGFTKDYTVAVWVGNFDSSPMQRVSGVTGAAPLWQRIMLHLHEQQEPATFAPPAGLVKRPICALTGEKPTPDCETVVQEYFFPEDLVAYENPSFVPRPSSFAQSIHTQGQTTKDEAPTTSDKGQRTKDKGLILPDEYNEWLARQGQTRLVGDRLRIVSPQNRDYFLVELGQSSGELLEFKLATVPPQPVEWRLNGTVLARQASQSFFWRARPGRWVLEVRQGNSHDRITFEVGVGEPETPNRGFSYQ